MKTPMKFHQPLATISVAALLNLGLCFSQLNVAHAQEPAPPPPPGQIGAPPPPPAPGRERGPRPGPDRGPGPRGEQPPPRPDLDQPPAPPVDPQAAIVAVKTATDAASAFTPGQVWTRTAPRGEQQLQATILFQNKEVARLEFDPTNASVMMRGQRLPVLPPEPGGPVGGPGTPPLPAAPPAELTDNENGGPSVPVPPRPSPSVSAVPVNLNQVKTALPETIKALRVGQGAELMDREGFWKVPLIYQNRVVADLHVSADGTKLIQDFAAARDAAIFAR